MANESRAFRMPQNMSLEDIVKVMSYNPANIMGIEGGIIETGRTADFVLFDPEQTWTVNPERLHGKSRNAVFKGETLTGQVKATYCSGKLVFHV